MVDILLDRKHPHMAFGYNLDWKTVRSNGEEAKPMYMGALSWSFIDGTGNWSSFVFGFIHNLLINGK